MQPLSGVKLSVTTSPGYAVVGVAVMVPPSVGDTVTVYCGIFNSKSGKTIGEKVFNGEEAKVFLAKVRTDLENAKITNEVRFSDDNGNNIEIGDYGVSQAAFVGDYCVATVFASDETYFFLFKGDDYVGQLDMSQVEPLFNFEPFSYDAGTDTLSVIGLSYSGYDVLLKFDPSDCSLKSQGQLDLTDTEIDTADYQVTDSGDLCRIDTLGNITRLGTESGTAETVIDNTWYSPYFSDLAGKNMLLTATAEKAIIVSTVST